MKATEDQLYTALRVEHAAGKLADLIQPGLPIGPAQILAMVGLYQLGLDHMIPDHVQEGIGSEEDRRALRTLFWAIGGWDDAQTQEAAAEDAQELPLGPECYLEKTLPRMAFDHLWHGRYLDAGKCMGVMDPQALDHLRDVSRDLANMAALGEFPELGSQEEQELVEELAGGTP